jgi:hypothetical protein
VTRGEKRILKVWFALILIISVFGLASAILVQNIWMVVVVFVVMGVDVYWFYLRYYRHRRPRYPLVPPEGKGDVYLPRTNVPRPIYEDYRRMKEKKRKFDKLRKMMRKRK